MKKKLCAALICLLLLLSATGLGASAADYTPAGTPVASAAEFAAMDPAGTYYLAADFSLSDTYTQSFSGTLNGNGKTLTVSAPLFREFNGTVRDLTLEGKITSQTGTGALAEQTRGMSAWNVVNRASVTVSNRGTSVGGFVGIGTDKAHVFFADCVNEGDLTAKSPTGAVYAGGLIGLADGILAYRCRNTGSVETRSTAGYAGGLVGRGASVQQETEVLFYACSNSGTVTSKQDAGGILATAGAADVVALDGYRFLCCENSGDITGARYTGGIVGYGYGSGAVQYLVLNRCLNTGTVASGINGGGFASQLAGYSNTSDNRITYNIGNGKVISSGTGKVWTVFIGASSVSPTADSRIYGNYLAKNDGTEWTTYALADSNSARRITARIGETNGTFERFTSAEAASGALCMAINRSARQNMFNQDLGTDPQPVPRAGAGYVVYDLTVEEDRFINGDEPRLPLCEEPEIPEDREGLAWFLAEEERKAAEPAETEPAGTETAAGDNPGTEPADEPSGCRSAALPIALLLPAAWLFVRRKKGN